MFRIRMILIAVVVGVFAATAPVAAMAADYGPFSELVCQDGSGCETPTISSHSTQHWIQSRIVCQIDSAAYYVVDDSNDHIVFRDSCGTAEDTGWKTTYGLYGTYYLVIVGASLDSTAGIRNCTSGCHIYYFN